MVAIAHTSQISASVRTEVGKGASRRARREGKIPAVLYGHGTKPQHLTLPAQQFAAVLRHAGMNAVLALDIDGVEQLALTKAVDIHPIRRTIEHADLLVVSRGEKVTVEVPLIVEGDPFPGSLVTIDIDAVEVEAEALSIPDQLTVSVEGLHAGTLITAKDLLLPVGVTLISDPDLILINIAEPHTGDISGEAASADAGE